MPENAAVTLASDRGTLEALVLGVMARAEALTRGALTVTGDTAVVERFFAMFDAFPLMFDVVG